MSWPLSLRAALVLPASLLLLCGSAGAAEFFTDTVDLGRGPVPAVKVEGRINPGDAAVFESIMARKPDELRKRYFLLLDSPGGDLREAIKLARLVRDVGFTTIVEKDARCISACFMLYAAGFTRLGQQGEQPFSHPPISTIGVHRAFIDPEVMKQLGPAQAREVVRASVTLSTTALREFDVPEPIIALMQATPASGVRFLTSDQLSTFAETPWFVDLAHARCGLVLPADNAGFKQGLEYESKLASCKLDVLVEHHLKKFPRRPAS